MDGKLIKNKNTVVCCFCGDSLLLENAAVINIKPNINCEESQSIFAHKEHLLEKLDKSIIVHPDFFEDETV